jgi:hypothetical protein
MENPEYCEKCGTLATRYISTTHFYGARVEDAYFNKGLGMVVRNTKHAEAEAKARGLEPVGNECPNKTYETTVKDRETRLAKRWERD